MALIAPATSATCSMVASTGPGVGVVAGYVTMIARGR
jgi:hypothetical protein